MFKYLLVIFLLVGCGAEEVMYIRDCICPTGWNCDNKVPICPKNTYCSTNSAKTYFECYSCSSAPGGSCDDGEEINDAGYYN